MPAFSIVLETENLANTRRHVLVGREPALRVTLSRFPRVYDREVADRPSSDEIAKWQKRFAVACNNRAWELIERERRTPAEEHEMLHAAHAAAWHWARAGTELNEARAMMLLGMAHALAGDGPLALRYATASFNYFNEHAAPDWEQAFAHLVLAAAAHAAGNQALHAEHYPQAERLGRAIAGSEDRAVFMRAFAHVPST